MSLADKVNAWANSPRGKAKIKACLEEYAKQGVTKTKAGTDIISRDRINDAVYKLMTMLYQSAKAADLPASVMQHIEDMSEGKPFLVDGHYEVPIYFGGSLHRDSLYSEGYDGVDNIVAIFNNGYSASDYVYGSWDGHAPTGESRFDTRSIENSPYIRSMKSRTPLRFIQQAVDDFNGNYGAEYNVTVEIALIYDTENS